VVLWVGVPCR